MGFFNFKDRLADKKVPCRVHGCAGTWTWTGEEQSRAWLKGDLTPPARMCESCYARSGEVADRTLPCSKPGCAGTWVWAKAAQLAAFARAEETGKTAAPPRGLCDACRSEVKSLPDREVPCRVRGCKRTWTWTGRAQILAGATDASAAPPAAMCEACHERYQSLRDEERPCRVPGCAGTWSYSRWAQVEAAASEGAEPQRMCDRCLGIFEALADRDVPCRTTGCKRSWRWKRGTQLEAWVAAVAAAGEGQPPPAPQALEPPSRMCADCARSYGELADVTVPCRVPGCKGTWVWKRGAQLTERRKAEKKAARKAAEKTEAAGPGPTEAEEAATPETAAAGGSEPAKAAVREPPARFCAECQKELEQLSDQELPCKHQADGCPRTFTWTRMAQLIARRRTGEARPPKHLCGPCTEFMKDRKTKTILCGKCGAELHWPPQSQLMTFLGKWAEPTICGKCRSSSGEAPAPASQGPAAG